MSCAHQSPFLRNTMQLFTKRQVFSGVVDVLLSSLVLRHTQYNSMHPDVGRTDMPVTSHAVR